MKKMLLLGGSCWLVVFILLHSFVAEAAPVLSVFNTYQQPNGVAFEAREYGDEFFSFTAGEDGTVYEKEKDGFWYYMVNPTAKKENRAKVGIDVKPAEVVTKSEIKQENIEARTTFNQGILSRQTGTWNREQNLLVVLVEFNDIKLSSMENEWSQKIFGDTGKTVKNFYLEQTNGRIAIQPAKDTGNVKDGILRIHMDQDHPDEETGERFDSFELSRNILQQVKHDVDFSGYDTNKSNAIELNELHVMFIIAGYDHTTWKQGKGVHGHKGWSNHLTTIDGIKFTDFTMFGEKFDMYTSSSIGLICHEFGHDLGLVDLYNTEAQQKSSGLGPVSVMSGGSWGYEYHFNEFYWVDGLQGSTPAGLDAYSKTLLGLPFEELDSQEYVEKTVKARSDQTDPTILKIQSANSNEYFLIENRQPTGFDKGMEGYIEALYPPNKSDWMKNLPGGIGIYRVNTNYHKNMTPEKQLVTILEADESVLGYSNYLNGKMRETSPFYYKGRNLMGGNQPYMLNTQTKPSTKLADGSLMDMQVEVLSDSQPEMKIRVGKAIPLQEINFSEDSMLLEVGQTKFVVPTLIPENATNKELTWKSSNVAIVSVTNDGKVAALKEGVVEVEVSNEDGTVTAVFEVKVNPKRIPVEKIELSSKEHSLCVKESAQLIATIIPENASNKKVSWHSEDPLIAEVDQAGNVAGKKEGTTTITALTEDGSKSASSVITVTNEDDHGNVGELATSLKENQVVSFKTNYKSDLDYFEFLASRTGHYVLTVKTNTLGSGGQRACFNYGRESKEWYDEETQTAYYLYQFNAGTGMRSNIGALGNNNNSEGLSGEIKIERLTGFNWDYPYNQTVSLTQPTQAQLSAQLSTQVPQNYFKMIYTSENPEIVSIDANGKMTALKEGKTRIKVYYPQLFQNAYIQVTTEDDHGDVVETATELLENKALSFKTNYKNDLDYFQFTAPKTGYYLITVKTNTLGSGGQRAYFNYSQENKEWYDEETQTAYYLYQFDAGRGITSSIRALGNNSDSIGMSGEIKIEGLTSGLNWSAPSNQTVSLTEPTQLQLGGTLSPQVPQKYFKVTYTSDNPEIISIDANGKMTALKEGKARITVYYPQVSQHIYIRVNTES